MKQLLFIFILSAAAVLCVFSAPLETLVPLSRAAELNTSEDMIIETQLKNPSPKLLPQNNELRQFVNKIKNALNPGMMVEALYLYKKPASFYSSVYVWEEEQKTKVFNQMLAISTLTGIQYHSSSRNILRTFYEYSNIIDEPAAKNPLPDPVFLKPPESLTVYARQKDLTFGDNIYRYDCTSTKDAIFFVQENITSLTYGVIPAIGKGNLRSIVAVIDCGESILIYAVSMAKAFSLPGMGDRISSSFSNRAEAVLNWLTGRLNSEIFMR